MANGEGLPDEIKTYIVQSLACYDPPSVVAKAVKDEFEVVVSRQAVHRYDPTKKAGADLSTEFKALFEETRKKFLESCADIGIANKTVRLRALDRMARAAEERGNIAMAAALLEQAAKETGGAFTNKHQHEHSGTVRSVSERIPPDLSKHTDEQLAQLYREAAAGSEGTGPKAGATRH